MAKRVRINIQFETVCFDDQLEFCKDTLNQDLLNVVMHGDYETEIEDEEDDLVDDFYHEMREMDN
jgi:hypothetical protein